MSIVLKTCLVIVVCSMALSGCAAAVKPPTVMVTGFHAGAIDQLVVLPVVDHRIDKSSGLDLDEAVLPLAERSLTDKHYPHTVVRDRAIIEQVTPVVLESPSRDWVSTLGPSGSRWLLLLVVEDASSSLSFGSTGNAEMSGYLFDKEQRTVVWRNKELSRVGQGGLIGMAMKGMMARTAVEAATREMFRALPFHHEK